MLVATLQSSRVVTNVEGKNHPQRVCWYSTRPLIYYLLSEVIFDIQVGNICNSYISES